MLNQDEILVPLSEASEIPVDDEYELTVKSDIAVVFALDSEERIGEYQPRTSLDLSRRGCYS